MEKESTPGKVGYGKLVSSSLAAKEYQLRGERPIEPTHLEPDGWLGLVSHLPSVPFYPFFEEGSPTKIGYRKRVPLF